MPGESSKFRPSPHSAKFSQIVHGRTFERLMLSEKGLGITLIFKTISNAEICQ